MSIVYPVTYLMLWVTYLMIICRNGKISSKNATGLHLMVKKLKAQLFLAWETVRQKIFRDYIAEIKKKSHKQQIREGSRLYKKNDILKKITTSKFDSEDVSDVVKTFTSETETYWPLGHFETRPRRNFMF